MTIIAWDGKTLAADKRSSFQGMAMPVTKIRRIYGTLVAGCGDHTSCLAMMDWIEKGSVLESIPARQLTEDWSSILCITPGKEILVYERGPYPIRVQAPFFACGSGRDYAMAAMHLGCDARKAVEIACIYETGCGNGIDTLEF